MATSPWVQMWRTISNSHTRLHACPAHLHSFTIQKSLSRRGSSSQLQRPHKMPVYTHWTVLSPGTGAGVQGYLPLCQVRECRGPGSRGAGGWPRGWRALPPPLWGHTMSNVRVTCLWYPHTSCTRTGDYDTACGVPKHLPHKEDYETVSDIPKHLTHTKRTMTLYLTSSNISHTQRTMTPYLTSPNISHTQRTITLYLTSPNISHTPRTMTLFLTSPNISHTQRGLWHCFWHPQTTHTHR